MGLKRQLTRSRLAGLAAALLTAAAGYALHEYTFGSGLANLSYDLLTVAKPQVAPADAVLVVMDESSHEELAQPLNAPWSRDLHAQLVNKLTAAGAKAIVFDIVFSDPAPGSSEADQRLARALAASKRVILAADHVRVDATQKRFIMPINVLREAAVGVGSAEVQPGRDLVVREHTPAETLPSLSAATADFLGWRDPDGAQAKWVRYYAPANLLPSRSYESALREEPGDFFRDKIVFVGARILTRFAGDRKDEYRTPYSFWTKDQQFVSGVEIQATMFLNLARGDWLRRFPFRAEAIFFIAIGALLGFALMQLRPWSATVGAALMVAAIAAAAYGLLLLTRVWVPWLIGVAQVGFALTISVTVNSFRLYLERRLYEQTLALYLSPKLVRKFAQDERFRQPGAEKQMLTILFSDIANFTGISEGMDSDDLANLMNNYFQQAVSQCIHATDGTVVKYIGDAIFAFWNAPDQQHDHAARACEAALRFRDQPVQRVNGHALLTRIGLHTGVANVGNFGSVQRVDYTALGENINLASRMEGLNKYLGTQVLITGATRTEVGSKFASRFLGKFRLKGFEKSVEVYELLGGEAHSAGPLLKVFQSALDALAQRDFVLARTRFNEALNVRPDDGPSIFYLHKLEELRLSPPPENWTGEIELKEK